MGHRHRKKIYRVDFFVKAISRKGSIGIIQFRHKLGKLHIKGATGTTVYRTPGNGRGALILKKHLLSGQRPRQFVRIAPGLVKIFKNSSGPLCTAFFW